MFTTSNKGRKPIWLTKRSLIKINKSMLSGNRRYMINYVLLIDGYIGPKSYYLIGVNKVVHSDHISTN